jgi:hypothetical protein
MSDEGAERVNHWLSTASDQDTQEKELAARYTAAASARLWVLHKLDDTPDEAPQEWAEVRELVDQADGLLDDDRQDEALFRRAQANLLALQLFEDSDEAKRPASEDSDDD